MEIFIAAWLSGVALAMWKIWLPSIQVIREVDPNNPLLVRMWLSTIIILVLFTIFLPIMILAILFDDHTVRFIRAFAKGAIDDK